MMRRESATLLCFLLCCMASCDSGFQDIDRRVEAMMLETSSGMGAIGPSVGVDNSEHVYNSMASPSPHTTNPSSDNLTFFPSEDIDGEMIAKSLDTAAEDLTLHSVPLPLPEALAWANSNAREMLFAKYDYLSSTLSLLSEMHVWGPRFFDSIDTDLAAASTDGLYDTSLTVVNDFSITQKLPYGGTVSASALTSIARSLHEVTTPTTTSTTDLGVSIEIPLMLGSGVVARESLIQAKRNLVYAARTYERFRRQFYREIVGDYLSLVVQKQSLGNAQRGVDSLRQLAKRQAALYESGRTRLYDSVNAENQALAAVARLSQSWEQYRLALDRFKIRIDWPLEKQIQVVASSLNIVPPAVDVVQAVKDALQYRLDLQNERDALSDSYRSVKNSLNDLLPNVSLTASASTTSDVDKPAKFSGQEVDYLAGLSISLPLDRKVERIAVRQQQIKLERAKRNYRESRDGVAVEVRSALRNVKAFQFSLELQERNVDIAQLGLDSINADPDRVSVLDQTNAISDLQTAQDARDSARRDLELSIIDYLLQAGQLRIGAEGELILPKTIPQ